MRGVCDWMLGNCKAEIVRVGFLVLVVRYLPLLTLFGVVLSSSISISILVSISLSSLLLLLMLGSTYLRRE